MNTFIAHWYEWTFLYNASTYRWRLPLLVQTTYFNLQGCNCLSLLGWLFFGFSFSCTGERWAESGYKGRADQTVIQFAVRTWNLLNLIKQIVWFLPSYIHFHTWKQAEQQKIQVCFQFSWNTGKINQKCNLTSFATVLLLFHLLFLLLWMNFNLHL